MLMQNHDTLLLDAILIMETNEFGGVCPMQQGILHPWFVINANVLQVQWWLIILRVFKCPNLCFLWDYLYVGVYGCIFSSVFLNSLNNLINLSHQAMSDENILTYRKPGDFFCVCVR